LSERLDLKLVIPDLLSSDGIRNFSIRNQLHSLKKR
jgi:hypothetical protein